jgi:hypothetical protein
MWGDLPPLPPIRLVPSRVLVNIRCNLVFLNIPNTFRPWRGLWAERLKLEFLLFDVEWFDSAEQWIWKCSEVAHDLFVSNAVQLCWKNSRLIRVVDAMYWECAKHTGSSQDTLFYVTQYPGEFERIREDSNKKRFKQTILICVSPCIFIYNKLGLHVSAYQAIIRAPITRNTTHATMNRRRHILHSNFWQFNF